MTSTDLFEDSVNHIANTFSDFDISMVDNGSSEGLNSILYFHRIILKLRGQLNNTMHIIHNDLKENNWVKTFKTI